MRNLFCCSSPSPSPARTSPVMSNAKSATAALPATYKAIQVSAPGGAFEIVDRPIPELGDEEVLVRVHACGVCHSDVFTKEGWWPGITFPRVPGHEVAGVVVRVGPHARRFKVGDRVGAGWHGGHCFACNSCIHGDFTMCEKRAVTGISRDGGYQEYMAASWESLALLPEHVPFAEAAPLLCAGVTVFNALQKERLAPGSVVAVQGIGGLGHLAVQYANRMGFKVVAVSRGKDKEALAKKLGAHIYIDTSSTDPVAALKALGGAKAIVSTAFDSKAQSSLVPALAPDGTLLVAGAGMTAIEVNPAHVIGARSCVRGCYSGGAVDSEDAVKFADLSDVKSMVEVYPFQKVNEAYAAAMENKARFRVVLSFE